MVLGAVELKERKKTKIKSMSLLINCFLLRRFTNYDDCWVHPPPTPACRSASPSTPKGGGVDRTGI
jgi:hypothetical protein